MSFREKIAWLSLGGILVAFGPYFAAVAVLRGGPADFGPATAGMWLATVSVLVTIMIIASVMVALTNLREAQVPSDERDREISRRALAFAYPVLLTTLFGALGLLFFGVSQGMLINAVLAAIVLGEVTRCSVEIVGYRFRG